MHYLFIVIVRDICVVGTGLLDTAKSDAKALNNAIENYIDALKEKGIADNVDKSNIIVDESKINESNNADITDDNNAKDNANNTENETTTKPSKETARVLRYTHLGLRLNLLRLNKSVVNKQP